MSIVEDPSRLAGQEQVSGATPAPLPSSTTPCWYTYMVRCADNTLYTGITTDLCRRVEEHNTSDKGAKYTRSRRPVKLVYSETFPDRSQAASREFALKKMPLKKKRALL